eukprot:13829983-Alexandrium_andersonii.AAC.1
MVCLRERWMRSAALVRKVRAQRGKGEMVEVARAARVGIRVARSRYNGRCDMSAVTYVSWQGRQGNLSKRDCVGVPKWRWVVGR